MSATMVGRQKKILNFRWPKKAQITLETISFWQNIFISILFYNRLFYKALSIDS